MHPVQAAQRYAAKVALQAVLLAAASVLAVKSAFKLLKK